jgi:D-lactate dehydrogenase (cytochrome)
MCHGVEMMNPNLLKTNVAADYPDYLRDESRKMGSAETISFPVDEHEVRHMMAMIQAGGCAVTTQGARTGITGGAVPADGHILNMSRMNRVVGLRYDEEQDRFFVIVQPGLILSELRALLQTGEFDTSEWSRSSLAALERFRKAGPFFFPPDPTEASASLGGMVACNASGACTFHYGPMRDHVEAIRVVLADGAVLSLRRGQERVMGRRFVVTTADGGRTIEGMVPSYRMPEVKNAAGFFASDQMDLLDLFVGSEGTLGVFTEVELRLERLPECRWGIMVFFPSEAAAVGFVKAVRSELRDRRPVAIEFFDTHALDLLRRQKALNPAFAEIPAMPPAFHTAIYVEYHGSEDRVSEAVERMSEWAVSSGGAEEATWVATTESELERFKYFRHAVPESVNLLIDERRKKDPEVTKLGTDMAVPDQALDCVLAMYREGLEAEGLESVMFGHIGNNHLHVNILPRTLQEYNEGKDLYLEWARQVVALGGTVSAEHGIGKFKVALLREMFGETGIHEMREVKRVFDPGGKLNRGNLF